MVNNFELIKPLLTFSSSGDEFYHLQIIQRKKDHKDGVKVNGTNNNSRLIKPYYIKSIGHLEFLEKEIIQLCEVFNARAGITLNVRSFEVASFNTLKKVTDQLMNRDYTKTYKAYDHAVGAMKPRRDKRWIMDIDAPYTQERVDKIIEDINSCRPGLSYVATIPSKSGLHIITKPFDLGQFRSMGYTNEEETSIQKNNPTNLYIP